MNLFARSLVQAVGTLCFMFYLSWKVSLVAFISVPIITISSKYYGNYVEKLSKKVQQSLAESTTVLSIIIDNNYKGCRRVIIINENNQIICFRKTC